MVEYTYDAWGNHTVSGSDIALGNKNPFRYRSYFYDTETGLYFLKTRYYDPATGRFINMDSVAYADPETVNGLNLYAYCLNNPVSNVDPDGNSVILMFILMGVIAGASIGGALSGVQAYNSGASGWSLVGAIAKGVIIGGIIGGVAGLLVGIAGNTLIGPGASLIGSALSIAGGGSVSGGALAVGAGAVAAGSLLAGGSVIVGFDAIFLFAKTNKSNGYYGERWPGDPHKPDHIHLRGNGIDIRIGRDGNPLPGEDPLNAQAKKALKRLWSEFVKLFNRW